jgi:FAD:protein FMN transferase
VLFANPVWVEAASVMCRCRILSRKRLSFLAAFLLCACTAQQVAAQSEAIRYEDTHESMGTIFSLVMYGKDKAFLAEVANAVFEEIDRVDAQMSNYKPDSEISNIDRHAYQTDVLVEPRLFHLLQFALQRSADTGGAFDPTVGPLMKHWGFFRGHGRLPSQRELNEVLKHVGYKHIKLNPEARTIRFDIPGIDLDLGAIAKGYAVDRGVDVLRSDGVTSALLSSGMSSIYALGAPPGERAWTVTIRDPFDRQKAADILRLKNYSISISGDYEKFFVINGKRYCHIMDPRTGWPVENMLSTVSLAATGTQTDGLSTSFFVMGVERSLKYLAMHPNLAGIVYQPDGPPPHYKRTFIRSDSFALPPDSIMEIERAGAPAK